MGVGNISERIQRVWAYHQSTKHIPSALPPSAPALDWPNRPSPYRIFDGFPQISLPTKLLDLQGQTTDVLSTSLDAVSQHHPPQDMKTLASWFYMADGLSRKLSAGHSSYWLRTCPSAGGLYPFEIYVVALGISDLASGFYHYSPREFSLRKLREATQALALLKRTWPDVGFLKSVPAVLLISSIFSRSAWKYRHRAYRYALLDCGHLLQNLVTSAVGLGIQPMVRMGVHDRAMRELIGVAPDADFAQAEAVQAMVVWAEKSRTPLKDPVPASAKNLPTIPRQLLATKTDDYETVISAHEACCERGVVVKEIRPKLTESSPLGRTHPVAFVPTVGEVPTSEPLGKTMLSRRSSRDFIVHPIPRAVFWELNRLAFRTGSFHPIRPDGPHVGIIRPFWIINDVTGMDRGIWYYHPPTDQWHKLLAGNCRKQARHLSMDQPLCRSASAVCFMAANLRVLMNQTGPDAYRLAHLEAGAVGQRFALASSSLKLGSTGIGAYYDDEVRLYLGLDRTGWEIIYELALGMPKPITDADLAMESPLG